MKRHALVGNVLHVVEVDEDGKMLSQEKCNLDDSKSLRILRLGEEPATPFHQCGNCFPPKFDEGQVSDFADHPSDGVPAERP